MMIFSQRSTENITIKNLKLTTNMVYVNEKFLILFGYYIPYERFCQGLDKDSIFKIVDPNSYHQKHETNLKVTMENFLIIITLFIPMKRK